MYICPRKDIDINKDGGELMTTLIIISCICFTFIIGRIFIVPIKWSLKIVMNSILGAFFIWIINIIGMNYGFHIGLNFVTSAIIRNFRSSRKCVTYNG